MRVLAVLAVSFLLTSTADARRLKPRPRTQAPDVVKVESDLYGIEKRALVQVALDAAAGELEARKHASGFELTRVVDGGTASKLGLEVGDVIKSVAGVALVERKDIVAANAAARTAPWIAIVLTRGSQEMTIHLRVLESTRDLSRGQNVRSTSRYQELMAAVGASVAEMVPDRMRIPAEVLRLPTSVRSVMPRSATNELTGTPVAGVQVLSSHTFINKLGLRALDVVTKIGTAEITEEEQLREAVAGAADGKEVVVELHRRGQKRELRWIVSDEDFDAESLRAAVEAYGVPSRVRATRSPALDATLDAGIKKVRNNQYEIKRDVVDALMGNPMAFARGARIVPSIKSGKANGFKVYAIRPGSFYTKIGLANGDTIHSINGHDLSSPDKALEAYTKIKKARRVTLKITRRGKPLELVYRITR